jgi:hypothetical protein
MFQLTSVATNIVQPTKSSQGVSDAFEMKSIGLHMLEIYLVDVKGEKMEKKHNV